MTVVWLPQAIENLVDIVDYIGTDNPAAAVELGAQIRAKASRLADHPTLYKPGRVRGTRECVVTENYLIVYRVKDEQVQVLRVLHARQQWPARK
uniref:Addiction module toxin, RelE/StbE n=1 Tax=Ralstonia solanacearum PSI07 TaxID=859657 RepID=D8MYD6_RALSL|nr:type II toxin-antitoxin system mRNA interferase toxin, RelE/StbE family [Ralstonia solanacearum]CBJ34352.1 Addiction module toxin, RelE/StbE [Ralstonia solanacearum PSI07]